MDETIWRTIHFHGGPCDGDAVDFTDTPWNRKFIRDVLISTAPTDPTIHHIYDLNEELTEGVYRTSYTDADLADEGHA